MRRTQLNLALAALAAGLGVAVYFSQEKEEKGPPLTSLKAAAIDTIALEHPGAETIKLERKDGGWKLVAPVSAEVDGFEINSVLGVAELETKQTLDAAQVKLSELSLDPSQYEVLLNDRRIAFGGVEPLNYRRYVKAGDKVYLVDDPPGAALDKDWADLVAKQLVPQDGELLKIELPGLTLAKGDDGKWSATPADAKATPEAVQKVVDGWKNARSMWNEQADAKVPAGDAVTLTLKDRTIKLVVAERDPQFKLYSPDARIRYVLSKALQDELLKLPEPKKEEPAAAEEKKAEPVKPDEAPAEKK